MNIDIGSTNLAMNSIILINSILSVMIHVMTFMSILYLFTENTDVLSHAALN